MLKASPTPSLTDKISEAQQHLKNERVHGDKLRIDLAESALNDLLDRLSEAIKK